MVSLSTGIRSWLDGGLPTALSSSYVIHFGTEMWIIWNRFKLVKPYYSATSMEEFYMLLGYAFLLSSHVSSIRSLILILSCILVIYWLFNEVMLLTFFF